MNYLKNSEGIFLDSLRIKYHSCEGETEIGQATIFPENYQRRMLEHVNRKWKRSSQAEKKGTPEEAYVAEKMWDYFKTIESNFKNVYCPAWSNLSANESGRQLSDKLSEFLDKIFQEDQENKHQRCIEDNVKKLSSTLNVTEKQEAIDKIKTSSAAKKKVTPDFGLWYPDDYDAFRHFGPPAGNKCDLIFQLETQKSPRSVLAPNISRKEYSEIVASNRRSLMGRNVRRTMGQAKSIGTKSTTEGPEYELMLSLSLDSSYAAMQYTATQKKISCKEMYNLAMEELNAVKEAGDEGEYARCQDEVKW